MQISTKELSLKEIILKGNEHTYKEEYNDAISCYDKAIKIDPNFSQAWNNKGLALYDLGRYEEAIECFDKALELDPYMTDAREYRDLAYRQLENPANSTGYEKTKKPRWKRLFGK